MARSQTSKIYSYEKVISYIIAIDADAWLYRV